MSDDARTRRASGRTTGAASTSWPTRPSSARRSTRIPAGRVRAARPGEPAHVRQADGRVARAGGRHRLHAPAGREDRPLRAAARGDRPGQAALLRHRDAAGRLRGARCSSRATRAARPRSKATRITRSAAARPTSSRRRRSSASTIPDRSQTLTYRGDIRPWSDVPGRVQGGRRRARARAAARASGCSPAASPRRRWPSQTRDVCRPSSRAMVWHQWEPAGRDQAREGARLAFGEYVDVAVPPRPGAGDPRARRRRPRRRPAGLRYAREFAAARRVTGGRREMNRLYVVEPTPSVTGSIADHRLPLQAGRVGPFALALAAALGVPGRDAVAAPPTSSPRGSRRSPATSSSHRGASLVVAGDDQPAAVHALVHAINQALGNVGRTVVYTEPVEAESDRPARRRCAQLAADMGAGKVDTLVVLDGNPVYTAPADLDVRRAADEQGAACGSTWGCYHDETAAFCHWHVPGRALPGVVERRARRRRHRQPHPAAHRAALRRPDGARRSSARCCRPTGRPVEPRHRARLLAASAAACKGGRVREVLAPGAARRRWWPDTARGGEGGDGAPGGRRRRSRAAGKGLEIVFRADPTVFDGRFANNGWLQELPKPLTKLTWDNAALVSPATAARLGVETPAGGRARATAAAGSRRRSGSCPARRPTRSPCTSATAARAPARSATASASTPTPSARAAAPVVRRRPRGPPDRRPLPAGRARRTSRRWRGAPSCRSATLEEFKKNPDFAHREVESAGPVARRCTRDHEYEGYAWGMAIDLNTCIGCNACVVACQAENNIPVVGKDRGRAAGARCTGSGSTATTRGDPERPTAYNQPVPCMQCENAPCELVCPVGGHGRTAPRG